MFGMFDRSGNAARGSRQHQGGQFQGAVGCHEGPEGGTQADAGQVARYGAAVEAVPQEEEHGADSPQKPRGEGLEGDADVVPDVVAEHGHVRITSPLPAETLPLGLVHPLVAGQILGRFDEEGHFGILLDQEG